MAGLRKAAATVLGLLASGLLPLPAFAQKPAAKPYDIHVILPLTGPGSFLGVGEQQSLRLVEKRVNQSGGLKGRPLRFVYHDDQSSPQTGVQLASGVLAAKPAVILGSSLVAICRAMGPLVKNGPVDYCFSPGLHPRRGEYAFTASVSTADLAAVVLRYFKQKGWTRLGFMFSTDATGQEFEQGINELLNRPEYKGMRIVAAEHFNPKDTIVSAQLQRIKQAKPQAMIAWSTGSPIATIFRGMLEIGLDLPVATTDGNMTYAQMRQYASFLPKQLFIPAGEFIARDDKRLPPSVAKVHDEFYKAFASIGAKPDEPSELAWEPAMLVVYALRQLGTQASAANIRDFLSHLKGYPGVDGVYDFEKTPQRGLSIDNAVVTRWDPQAKTFQVVSEPGGAPVE